MAITFEPLAKRHDRSHFRCGEAELDEWFQKRAGQDERRNVARVFVALDDDSQIVGFYSLSAFTLSLDEMPDDVAAKLPRYDHIPAALIGRLARHERSRGKGIGEILIADALHRIVNVAQDLAVFAIVVQAKNGSASDFYRSFGFIPFPMHPDRLFMLTSTATAALKKANPSANST
ncbi:GNAT family N-acetyltransferase [Pelagerythrobacter marensis]|uniref:GNAT family N-acetyltransferase n=1 Tax=Pelagerythrobacter marensis TaxID=543877 RepID=A0ABZ2D6U9_9SPHN